MVSTGVGSGIAVDSDLAEAGQHALGFWLSTTPQGGQPRLGLVLTTSAGRWTGPSHSSRSFLGATTRLLALIGKLGFVQVSAALRAVRLESARPARVRGFESLRFRFAGAARL